MDDQMRKQIMDGLIGNDKTGIVLQMVLSSLSEGEQKMLSSRLNNYLSLKQDMDRQEIAESTLKVFGDPTFNEMMDFCSGRQVNAIKSYKDRNDCSIKEAFNTLHYIGKK